MAECDLLDVLKSEEIIAKVTKFLQEGCGYSRGTKGGQCCEQFSKEAVLSNLTIAWNCHMENSMLLSWPTFKHARIVISLAKKGNEIHDPASFTLTVQSARICS